MLLQFLILYNYLYNVPKRFETNLAYSNLKTDDSQPHIVNLSYVCKNRILKVKSIQNS